MLPATRAGRYKFAKLMRPYLLHSLDLTTRPMAREGLEGRSPMLMRSFIEFSATTPERIRRQGGLTKVIHRRAMKGILPDTIVERKTKAEFSIAAAVLAPDLQAWFNDYLPTDEMPAIDLAGLARLLETFAATTTNSRSPWFNQIWGILTYLVLSSNSNSR